MPSAPGANGIAPLVRNSIDAHIEFSLIWLAVSETRHLFLIFDLEAVRPIRARMSLVRTSNARRHWPRMGCGRPGATASTMARNRSSASLGSRGVASFVRLPGIGQHGTTHQMAPINPRTLMPHSKRTRRTMMDSNTLQRNAHPVRHEAATHLFAIGQIVRLKGGFGLQSQSADTYRITATLPPQGDSQQYRIRNDDEHYERVARQDSLEPARILPVGPSGALIEGTFGAGQAIETQHLRDQKSRSRRRPSPSLKAQELG